MQKASESLGVYLSVPFCRAKCSFCNFASGVGTAETVDRYVGRLCEEIRGARRSAQSIGAHLPDAVDTVYFGGGTPSLLEPAQLRRIFDALRGEFHLLHGAEITLETAPGQIGDELLEAALESGVNRVSFGVQSFVDRETQVVGRSHTEASCRAEFQRLRRAGLTNLGADLIAGLPYQTEASWEHSLEIATSCDLAHLSVYMLEVDDDSRLGREVLSGGARLHAPAVPGDDLIASLYERACEWLPGAGYPQYEVSNFASYGSTSRHNLKYWLRDSYLGFGLDAHSMLHSAQGDSVRWANPDELADYTGSAGIGAAARSTQREVFDETVFLGLRLVAGLSWTDLDGFPKAWMDELSESVQMLAREGLMDVTDDRLRLTARGRLISSEIFGELLAGVPA